MIRKGKFSVRTGKDLDIQDITEKVREILQETGVEDGIVNVFVKGSTASISTMEFEPNLKKDIENALERIAPSDMEYEHHKTWGDFNGKSHVRAALVGPSISVPIRNGELVLGEWEQIVLLDFDTEAREREIFVTVLG